MHPSGCILCPCLSGYFYKILFLLNVFQAVQCNGYQNDNTGEYELKVGINTQNSQGIGQCCKDAHTYYYA